MSGSASNKLSPASVPTCPTRPTCLTCLPYLPVEPSLRRDLDLDRPGLGLLAQREPDGQNAVLVVGRDLVRVNGLGQRERPAERAIPTLDAMELRLPE